MTATGHARQDGEKAGRIAVDVGGTFTDLVVWDADAGAVRTAKGLTTPAAMEHGVAAVLDAEDGGAALATSQYFIHATTAGLNALLQRRDVRLALIATAGFRDILEMRRGEREALNDLRWSPDAALVPRRLRFGVRERVAADGSVITPLDAADVTGLAEILSKDQIETIAVALLHGYANPKHEQEIEAGLRAAGFAGEISMSHEISREFREYERTATTVADAYIRPIMANYLDRLETHLRQRRFDGEALVTASGGGAMSFAEARRRPVETIMSGPVGGVTGAAALCDSLGIADAITADVGGTSFDTCLILDGRPEVKYEGRIDGLPIQTRWIDVRSVGAGGGSIAWVDEGGLLRAGPQSAGAVPGPAAYGRGGMAPTATDAAAALGMFGPAQLAGGVNLDTDLAKESLKPLARALGGLELERLAEGILLILTSAMADAIRGITIERGRDPREAALISYGGAGPLFAALIARHLGIRRVVVPPHAGNFSAWGLLQQDVVTGAALTRVVPLSADGLDRARQAYAELARDLERRGEMYGHRDLETSAQLDLRFSGQEYTLTVPAPELCNGGGDPGGVLRRFSELYERTYGHLMDEDVEIVTIRAVGTRSLPKPPAARSVDANGSPRRLGAMPLFSFARRGTDEFQIVDRGGLRPGERLHGPAVLIEPTSTTYLDHGFRADVGDGGVLLITDEG